MARVWTSPQLVLSYHVHSPYLQELYKYLPSSSLGGLAAHIRNSIFEASCTHLPASIQFADRRWLGPKIYPMHQGKGLLQFFLYWLCFRSCPRARIGGPAEALGFQWHDPILPRLLVLHVSGQVPQSRLRLCIYYLSYSNILSNCLLIFRCCHNNKVNGFFITKIASTAATPLLAMRPFSIPWDLVSTRHKLCQRQISNSSSFSSRRDSNALSRLKGTDTVNVSRLMIRIGSRTSWAYPP